MNDFISKIYISNENNLGLREDHDYLNKEDGLYHCMHCGEPRQFLTYRFEQTENGLKRIEPPDLPFWQKCSCMIAVDEQEKANERRHAADILRRDTFRTNKMLADFTFAGDDSPQSEASRICKGYVNTFDSISSQWLFLYGDVGRGKTYYAGCIANALIDKGHTVFFGTITEFERLNSFETREGLFENIRNADLLIIDDLSSERKTEYMSEIAFTVIDTRIKSGKPCVITSNMKIDEFIKSENFNSRRILSRIIEKSYLLFIAGEDRRMKNIQAKNNAQKEVLLAAADDVY